MSHLSWLNPTPHAIAVYASQPLSPVTTQHSLSSGRYSLLEPDFHRLDRTSLRLAHLFDHLVGSGKKSARHRDADCFGGLEVDHQVEFGGLHDRQIARLGSLQNSAGIKTKLTVGFGKTGSVGRQGSICGERA